VPGNWRRGASQTELESRLDADKARTFKAVVVVHNETSTGVTSRIGALRTAMNRVGHPALLIVDAVSSLGSIDFRQDEWAVDVTVVGSQKGLMLPPGLGFNALSEKAVAASRSARLPRNYWDWRPVLEQNRGGFFPYTPATNLLFALREAVRMLHEEGIENVFLRHDRHARATRTAVQTWGLDIVCEDPREYSSSMTAFFMPEGHDADRFRSIVLEHFDMSLGVGLSRLAGKVVRIGHLGGFNDLMLAATLSGIEMGLRVAGVPHREGGVTAALRSLTADVPAPQPIGQ
jgi:alanine-glyoxylate transaminase/serine-glyoxylate transaminase/serine-pyruvate transaminase